MPRKTALVVGRTFEDLEQCRKLNMPLHPPSPTTCLWNDYANFDGDIVTAQSIKFGAVACGSIELSKRVYWASEQHPNKVWVGTSQHAHDYQCPKEYRDKINFLYTDKHEYPVANSGLFSLWLAIYLGYEVIYTIGLDLISIGFTHGHKYDHSIATRYVQDFEQGKDLTQYPIETHLKDDISFDIVNKIIQDHPHIKIYKTGKFSQLPVPIRKPTQKGLK